MLSYVIHNVLLGFSSSSSVFDCIEDELDEPVGESVHTGGGRLSR